MRHLNRGSPIHSPPHEDMVTGTWHSFSHPLSSLPQRPVLVPANERRPLLRWTRLRALRTAEHVLFVCQYLVIWWLSSFEFSRPPKGSLHPWPIELVGCYFFPAAVTPSTPCDSSSVPSRPTVLAQGEPSSRPASPLSDMLSLDQAVSVLICQSAHILRTFTRP